MVKRILLSLFAFMAFGLGMSGFAMDTMKKDLEKNLPDFSDDFPFTKKPKGKSKIAVIDDSVTSSKKKFIQNLPPLITQNLEDKSLRDLTNRKKTPVEKKIVKTPMPLLMKTSPGTPTTDDLFIGHIDKQNISYVDDIDIGDIDDNKKNILPVKGGNFGVVKSPTGEFNLNEQFDESRKKKSNTFDRSYSPNTHGEEQPSLVGITRNGTLIELYEGQLGKWVFKFRNRNQSPYRDPFEYTFVASSVNLPKQILGSQCGNYLLCTDQNNNTQVTLWRDPTSPTSPEYQEKVQKYMFDKNARVKIGGNAKNRSDTHFVDVLVYTQKDDK